jgi:hypothetical protein
MTTDKEPARPIRQAPFDFASLAPLGTSRASPSHLLWASRKPALRGRSKQRPYKRAGKMPALRGRTHPSAELRAGGTSAAPANAKANARRAKGCAIRPKDATRRKRI